MIAEKLKKSILQEAIQGRLVPQNPDDEPASALLERIREEKRDLVKAGKIKADKQESVIFRGSDNIKGTISGRFYERIGKDELIDITEELPFDIPENWEWARFGNITINKDGQRIPLSAAKREKLSKIYNYYGASGIIDKVDQYIFDKRLLLIGEDGANLLTRSTPIAFIAEGKYWVNNHAHVIDTYQHMLLDFISLYINSISLASYVTGTAQPKMNQAKLNTIFIAVPPLNEQKIIVSTVNQLLLKIKDYQKIETKVHQINISFPDKFRKSVLQAAVQGKLVPQNPDDEPASVLLQKVRKKRNELIKSGKIKKPKNESYIFRREDSWFEKIGKIEKCIDEELPFKIPNNWAWERVGNIGTFIRGSGIKRSDITSEGVGCIRYGEIYTTYNISFSEPKSFISPDLSKSLKKIDTNDLLFTLTGENKEEIGKTVAYTGERGICAGGDLGIYKYHFLTPLFLSYIFNSPYGIFKKSELGTGNIIVHISCDKLSNILIPIAPINEQLIIVRTINSLFSIM